MNPPSVFLTYRSEAVTQFPMTESVMNKAEHIVYKKRLAVSVFGSAVCQHRVLCPVLGCYARLPEARLCPKDIQVLVVSEVSQHLLRVVVWLSVILPHLYGIASSYKGVILLLRLVSKGLICLLNFWVI